MNKKRLRDNENLWIFCIVILAFLSSRIFMLSMAYAYRGVSGNLQPIRELFNQWDAERYLYIIYHGYTFPIDTDPQANWAFFPAYPILVCVVKTLLMGVDGGIAGIITSDVCTIVAAFFAVKYVKLLAVTDAGEEVVSLQNPLHANWFPLSANMRVGSVIMALLFMWAPYTFYFHSTYTESLFIMAVVLFFYNCRQKNYLVTGCMAALASATRIVGCLLVFALVVELFLDYCAGCRAKEAELAERADGAVEDNGKRRSALWVERFGKNWKLCVGFVLDVLKKPKELFAILICPIGTFAYMIFLYFFCGDAWAFKNTQIAWREESYFPVLGVFKAALSGQMGDFEPERYTYMAWFCIGIFILYGYMWCRKYYSETIFGVIALLVPLTSHVMSTCRFVVGGFVAFVGIYDLLKRYKWLRVLVGFVFLVAETYLLFMWFRESCWIM